ncbi:EPIDERMAL PATTERNING FACTOR-like protein 1 [Cicer arietinum]|uniref:Epidermal patterning factor-like protein n=1 Tax=Cicer arietinum TaxID=3827 RepID=A0A1S2YGC1_CICAR|nr:EPIDERMAL PATTERNING FACTOR-like protein 1 [Cicer arietinum]
MTSKGDINTFMASLNSHQNFSTTTTILLTILLLLHPLLHPVSSSNKLQPSTPPQELLFEEKNKLGSIPPSCHSKCNECHPCMAVQVPSMGNFPLDLNKVSTMERKWVTPISLQGNSYSNYKPLGWKCRCGDHFFNP